MARSLSQLFYAMGGSVSAGKSNDELIDHLVDAEFIRTAAVQRVFRAVDRGNYYHPNHKQNAYKDIAWRMGNLHLSAPCVYSVVMEALKLKPGLSFLNLGSGSGYLSTMAGLILGRYGTNHGIEYHKEIVEYAYDRLDDFLKTSKVVDEYDFCEPVFTTGNCLTLDSNSQQYDRVYCGAACPEEYETYVKNLVKVDGILIMPLNDKLLKITRVNETTWTTVKILSVSFAPLIPPPETKKGDIVVHAKLGDIIPPNLQQICRFSIRSALRKIIDIEHPELKNRKMLEEFKANRRVQCIVFNFDNSNQSESDEESDNAGLNGASLFRSLFRESFLIRTPSDIEEMNKVLELRNSLSKNGVTFPENGTSDAKPATSSDESDINFDQPPSQSTRSKRKLLKRKRSFSHKSPSSSSSSTPEPSRKATCTEDVKSSVKLDLDKKVVKESSYTYFLTQKIRALQLPHSLLQYLNYKRDNF